MEYAAVEFLLENLKQLQLHRAHLISDDTKNQIQVLESNLCLFKRLLNDSTDRIYDLECGMYRVEDLISDEEKDEEHEDEDEDEEEQEEEEHEDEEEHEEEEEEEEHEDEDEDEDKTLKQVVQQIIQVVYKAEDAVDAIVSQAAEKGVESYFKGAFDGPAELLSAVQQAELIGAKVKEIYDHKKIDFAMLQTKRESNPQQQQKNLHVNRVYSWREDYVMVGLEDEAETLINYLKKETDELGVICIVGISGLGKTTIARHIFRLAEIAYEFPTRLWVYCSANFRRKDVYLTMLRDLNCITEDMYGKTDKEIAETLRARLEREKFLIVFDDLEDTGDWDALRDVLPKSNTRSKILITSYSKYSQEYHELRVLDSEESWTLLQLTAFGKGFECPSDLEMLGKCISRQCEGQPLEIMLAGGILAKTASAGGNHEIWKKVYECLEAKIYGLTAFQNVVTLSYNMLPRYLRPCFLYMGMFPNGFEIPVQRLILLWIAEGFMQQKTGTTVSLEETGMEYLEELIDRKLVMIGKVGLTGRIKTCRLHNLIHSFCLYKAEKYFFSDIINPSFVCPSGWLHTCRHISMNCEVVRFLSSQPRNPYVRTFFHFSREETILLPENVSSIPDCFILLRVLDAMPIRFTRFPFHLTHLVHLRYIALSSDFKVLPEAISKMWNIQTLIVDTSLRTLEIKADIWKMNQLRHLETNASIILRKSTRGDNIENKGEKIHTLSNVSPESCTQVFERATNLKKLGIRGRLAILMDHDKDGSCPFDGLRNLHLLEKLKLLNDIFASSSDSQLPGLPPPFKFPPKLMSLTLSYTFLDWKHMCILGMLENLKVLRLKNNAFVGECWEAADDGFCQLEILQVEYTNLFVWKASGTHFPKLKNLMLRNCEQLEALPLGLADVSSLQVIDLYRTTKSAAASAKKIVALAKERELELSIFPHDD